MKIIHTSDWHLGRYLHEYSLIKDQEYILNALLKLIKIKKCNLLIISGDIYDRSVPPPEAISLFSSFLFELHSDCPDTHVFIIPGNHDSAVRLGFGAQLFEAAGIHFRTNPADVERPVRITAGEETADIYMLPFLYPGTYDLFNTLETKTSTHEDAVKTAISRIKKSIDPNCINILIGHMFTHGGQGSDSERSFTGTAGYVNPEILNGFHYTALGHLHKPQRVNDRVFYSGSLLKYSFSEIADKKQVVIADVSGNGEIETSFESLKPLREMKRISGTFSELANNDKDYRDCYIEIELTDSTPVVNAMGRLKEFYPYLLSLRQSYSGEMSAGRARKGINPGGTIEDDFLIFQEYLYDTSPSVKKRALFIENIHKVETDETS